MMIPSYESIEKMYEAGISSFGIFDRRILLPVEQVAMAVEAETRAKVSESDLHEFAADGCYAPLPLPWGIRLLAGYRCSFHRASACFSTCRRAATASTSYAVSQLGRITGSIILGGLTSTTRTMMWKFS